MTSSLGRLIAENAKIQGEDSMTGIDVFLGIVVFGVLFIALGKLLEGLAAVAKGAFVNFVSTLIVVFGAVLGFALLAGTEASAAVAIAVPAAATVAKMRAAVHF